MGETIRNAWLRDLIRIRRDGELLLHDAIRLDGPVHDLLQRPAIGRGARVVSTVLVVAPDAETMLEPVRSAIGAAEAGVSAWNGMLVARILGEDECRGPTHRGRGVGDAAEVLALCRAFGYADREVERT